MDAKPYTAETTTTSKPKRQPRGTQPKTQAPKNAIAVKARRKILARELLKGTPSKKAGIIAGFSPATAASQVSQTLKDPKFQNSIHAAMERLNMGDDYLAAHLRKLIDATKIISANIIVTGGGSDLDAAGSIRKDYIQVPDYAAVARGLDLICRLRGLYKDRTEVDVKQPVTMVIRKFCSRGSKDAAGNTLSPVEMT